MHPSAQRALSQNKWQWVITDRPAPHKDWGHKNNSKETACFPLSVSCRPARHCLSCLFLQPGRSGWNLDFKLTSCWGPETRGWFRLPMNGQWRSSWESGTWDHIHVIPVHKVQFNAVYKSIVHAEISPQQAKKKLSNRKQKLFHSQNDKTSADVNDKNHICFLTLANRSMTAFFVTC